MCENYHFNYNKNIYYNYFNNVLYNTFPKLNINTCLHIYKQELDIYLNYLEIKHREYYCTIFNVKRDTNHFIWERKLMESYSLYNFDDINFKEVTQVLFKKTKILQYYDKSKISSNYLTSCGILFNNNTSHVDKYEILSENVSLFNVNEVDYNKYENFNDFKNIAKNLLILKLVDMKYKNVSVNSLKNISFTQIKIYEKYFTLENLFKSLYKNYTIFNNNVYIENTYFNEVFNLSYIKIFCRFPSDNYCNCLDNCWVSSGIDYCHIVKTINIYNLERDFTIKKKYVNNVNNIINIYDLNIYQNNKIYTLISCWDL